jgi:class 3 adenylate cyclase/pimeloyl-ACP methyl ester carboxylesterase
MEPRIQYAKTSDGVNIAFAKSGDGPPFVVVPPIPWTNLEVELSDPGYRSWFEIMSRNHSLVLYDSRGSGLSDREANGFTPEDFCLDIDAVTARLGFERFAILGTAVGGQIAIVYAASRPGRVSQLVLWNAAAHSSEIVSAAAAGLAEMARVDWDMFTETVAHAQVAGWGSSEEARNIATMMRASIEHDSYLLGFGVVSPVDVTPYLLQVVCPTLVIQRREIQKPNLEAARKLAAQIPAAELVIEPGASMLPWVGDMDATVRHIERFLGVKVDVSTMDGAPAIPSGMAVILFADIVESTALTERLGDSAFREKARGLDDALRSLIREHSGTPIDGQLLGDGVLAVFTSASEAIKAALACGIAGEDAGLPLHLGLHAGDVIREGDNVYGGAVNIASRISGLSAPGEVLVSRTIADLARTSAGVTFEDRGEHALKGVAGAQRVFAARQDAS